MQAGVRHVEATINGYGERCGNANMVSVLAGLALKTDLALAPTGGGELAALTELSRGRRGDREHRPERLAALRRTLGVRPQAGPRRRGGQGRAELPAHRPDGCNPGERGRLVVSELGGRANTRLRAEQLGHQLDGIVEQESCPT